MPFRRPTLTQLRAQAAADIVSGLPGADPLLRFSNLKILADTEAGMVAGLYGFLDWIALQSTPFTATGEFLEGWAGLKGVTREAASRASGPVQFSGTNGTPLPSGTVVVRGDGVSYKTTADGTVSGGAVIVDMVADLAGAAGNAGALTIMTLGVAIGGIASGGAASGAIAGGADVETDASLRSRMLAAYAAAPQGGDAADYVSWARQVAGVTRAWWGGQNAAAAGGPAGTVIVYFMMDEAEGAFGGFPQGTNGVAADETRDTAATGDQLAVANRIFPLRPVTALVYAFAPAANLVDITIAGISGAPMAVQTAIKLAIDQVYLDHGAPGGTVDLSYIEAAIAAVAGTASFVITIVACSNGTVSPGTDGNITAAAGYLSVRHDTTFI